MYCPCRFHEDDWKDGRNRDTRSRKCKPGYESCVTAERDMNRRGKDGVEKTIIKHFVIGEKRI